MKDKQLVTLGKKIRALRLERGWSQEHLSHLAELDRSYMGRVERGEKNITVLKVYQIAAALDVPAKDLL